MNIFLARTPYHAFVAHLVQDQLLQSGSDAREPAILVLTDPRITDGPTQRIINPHYWRRVAELPIRKSFRIRETVRSVDEWLRDFLATVESEPETVFVGDDQNWLDQILTTGIAPQSICLFEDGLGSYYTGRLPWLHSAYRRYVLKNFLGGRMRHMGPVSQSMANRYYALGGAAFPWRRTTSPLVVIGFEPSPYRDWLTKQFENDPDVRTLNAADLVVLTQPLWESGLMKAKADLALYESMAGRFRNVGRVAVKKHPRESTRQHAARRHAIAKGAACEATVELPTRLPVEILVAAAKPPPIVAACSTALINIRRMHPEVGVYYYLGPVRGGLAVGPVLEAAGVARLDSEETPRRAG